VAGSTARAWPHRNAPDDIRARQAAIRSLPQWGPEWDFVFGAPVEPEAFARVQECFTGYAAIPVGVVGPLEVDLGLYELDAHGRPAEVGRRRDRVFVPLAHTEGGLTASMLRGVNATRLAGGVRTFVLQDRMTRDSCFAFDSTAEAVRFARWIEGRADEMARWLADPGNPLASEEGAGRAAISRHAVLREVRTFVLGNVCHVLYRFTTGDACGPNMMTRNAYALNRHFVAVRFPRETGIAPRRFVLEANMGGDKKPSYEYFHEGHGKTVVAEATLPQSVLRRVLRVSAEDMVALQELGLHGSHASGMQSAAFTPASAIAAIFAATGQDLGMVGTSSMAHEAATLLPPDPGAGRNEPALHVAIRLPGLEVGTVGGGTVLPHARAWLRLMDCDGPGRVYRFAQIVAAATLCLELSASASMAAQGSENFYRAHLERGGLRLAPAGDAGEAAGAAGLAGTHPR
jgi:hydroxymethylglutaryl-CoA reductase (NADPH)